MNRVNRQSNRSRLPTRRGSSDGYVLYLVLFLLSICGILGSVALVSVRMVTMDVVRRQQRLQARLLAESGIERAEFFLNGGDGHDLSWETAGMDERLEPYGSIHLVSRRFGGFARVASIGKCRGQEYAMHVLMGRDIPPRVDATVTLTGRIKGLLLDQRSSLEGTLVLHHGSLMRGEVRSGPDDIRAPIRDFDRWTRHEAAPHLPFDTGPLDTIMEEYAQRLDQAPAARSVLSGSVSLEQPVSDSDTTVVDGDCTVAGLVRNANAVITGTLRLSSTADCRGCFFLAGKLEVEGGRSHGCLFFTKGPQSIDAGVHASQFLATDSIVIGDGVTFPSPSLVVSYRAAVGDTGVDGGITVGEGCTIEGHLLAYVDSALVDPIHAKGFGVVVGKGCAISGSVITNCDVYVEGMKLDGHLWCHLIHCDFGEREYTNWLKGCTIGPLRACVPYPLLGKLPATVGVVAECR